MLPALYAPWVEELLGGPAPLETDAACERCVMVAGQARAPGGTRQFFDPLTRCCTYIPALPNYLVGRILADRDPRFLRGRHAVAKRLRTGAEVTPVGFGRPAAYALLYTRAQGGFGHSRALRCPYHQEDGGCGIWPHRPAVCATWFCKHVRGDVGRTFWRALELLLRAVEDDLARWCLLESGVEVHGLAESGSGRLDAHQLDGRLDPEKYAAAWGTWAGRGRELYAKCGRLIGGLAWRDVAALLGPGTRLLLRSARRAFAELASTPLPGRLRAGPFVVLGAARRRVTVAAYSQYDPLLLPAELLGALPYFDGRPVGEALRSIVREKRLRLDPGLLRRLIDFRVLVPTSGPKAP